MLLHSSLSLNCLWTEIKLLLSLLNSLYAHMYTNVCFSVSLVSISGHFKKNGIYIHLLYNLYVIVSRFQRATLKALLPGLELES